MKFLFLGGPVHGKWYHVENPGQMYRVPMPSEFRYSFDINPISALPVRTIDYRMERLLDYNTGKTKLLYVVQDISLDKTMDLLHDYLLSEFINAT
jgi:hypothetical protein